MVLKEHSSLKNMTVPALRLSYQCLNDEVFLFFPFFPVAVGQREAEKPSA